ncbi:HIT-like domain-containing protein [Abortiporus biennis]|nr:HIT-like domain-containing protein [Abortiporus biennis]
MAEFNADDKCLFCAIVAGKIPCYKVYETDKILVFLDISPVSEGHTQVIPKYHAKTLLDVPDEYMSEIGPVLKKVIKAIGVEQYNVLQNNGKLAFQHIDHVHFHVLPKTTPQDGLVLRVEDFVSRKASPEALEDTLKKIKARI